MNKNAPMTMNMNREAMIRKYVVLALSKLERDLTSQEEEEMSKIRTGLGMTHEEIVAVGKSLIVQ